MIGFTIQDIEDKLFLINDKIRWSEMLLAHAKEEAHELQEYLFDLEDRQKTKVI